MDPRHTIHQRFNWTNKSHPTNWLNKLLLSWSLMIYGGRTCHCCSAETCASAERCAIGGGLAGVSGTEFIASHRGASDLFLLPLRRVSVLFLTLVGTKHRSDVALCLSDGFFQHSRAYLGYNRKSHVSTWEQGRSAKKSQGPGIIHGHWCMQRSVHAGCQKNCVFPGKKNPAHLQDGWLLW